MNHTPIDLNDATVAITGGARGIGLATARMFAARGARVAIGDLDAEHSAEAAASAGATGFKLDVTDPRSFATFLEQVEETFGPVDVLVNNAGIMPAGPFLDESRETSDAQIDVNLRGPIHGMKLALPGMLDRRRGHIVNVASMAGKAHVPGLAVYNGTKFGLVGLSEAVRDEIHGSGVTITTIMPTAVKTELISGLPSQGVAVVTPEDVARAVVDSVEHRRPEVAVPRWFGAYGLVNELMPRRMRHWVRRRIGAWRLMEPANLDAGARREYDERIGKSAAPDPSAERGEPAGRT